MLFRLMLVELEGNVRLPLAAVEHFLFELVLGRAVPSLRTEQFSSLLKSGTRLSFAFVIVPPVKSHTDWAAHI